MTTPKQVKVKIFWLIKLNYKTYILRKVRQKILCENPNQNKANDFILTRRKTICCRKDVYTVAPWLLQIVGLLTWSSFFLHDLAVKVEKVVLILSSCCSVHFTLSLVASLIKLVFPDTSSHTHTHSRANNISARGSHARHCHWTLAN